MVHTVYKYLGREKNWVSPKVSWIVSDFDGDFIVGKSICRAFQRWISSLERAFAGLSNDEIPVRSQYNPRNSCSTKRSSRPTYFCAVCRGGSPTLWPTASCSRASRNARPPGLPCQPSGAAQSPWKPSTSGRGLVVPPLVPPVLGALHHEVGLDPSTNCRVMLPSTGNFSAVQLPNQDSEALDITSSRRRLSIQQLWRLTSRAAHHESLGASRSPTWPSTPSNQGPPACRCPCWSPAH